MSEPTGIVSRSESPPIASATAQRYRVIEKLESGGMA